MKTQMGSSLPSEKLDRSNFSYWENKINQYLVGQGYGSYINDAQENRVDPKNVDYWTWEQVASRIMYCLAACVHNHILDYIRKAKMPKEAWENLRKIFAANTTSRRLQLC